MYLAFTFQNDNNYLKFGKECDMDSRGHLAFATRLTVHSSMEEICESINTHLAANTDFELRRRRQPFCVFIRPDDVGQQRASHTKPFSSKGQLKPISTDRQWQRALVYKAFHVRNFNRPDRSFEDDPIGDKIYRVYLDLCCTVGIRGKGARNLQTLKGSQKSHKCRYVRQRSLCHSTQYQGTSVSTSCPVKA